MRTLLKSLLAVSIMIGPYTFSIATTPAALWHEYVVRGNVLRATGPKANFAVALEGKVGRDRFQLLRGPYNGRWQSPVSLTDSAGAFSIIVDAYVRFDSLRVNVVIPDRDPVPGQPFPVAIAQVLTEYTTVDYTDPETCSGCRTTGKTSVVAGYVYNYPEQNVTLPF
jgi:hypothetical protein